MQQPIENPPPVNLSSVNTLYSFEKKRSALILTLFFLLIPHRSPAEEKTVGVLISQEIAPFIAMVEGMEVRLGNRPVQRFFLDRKGRPYSLDAAGGGGELLQHDVLVAVGPTAFRHLHPRVGKVPLVYGMVLNPRKVVGNGHWQGCGVSLNLPVDRQFEAIRNHLPSVRRLGILFDPKNNQPWFDHAVPIGRAMDLELVALQVTRFAKRLSADGDFAVMFIPDKSIISKTVIQYVIKTAVIYGVPVIGYNRFFNDSGAALSFVIDYGQVGDRVGMQVERLLAGEGCTGEIPPPFTTLVNRDVWRILELDTDANNESVRSPTVGDRSVTDTK